jgi:hypothetical protein
LPILCFFLLFVSCYYNLGVALMMGGKLEDAAFSLETSLSLGDPVPDAHANLGNIYAVQNK